MEKNNKPSYNPLDMTNYTLEKLPVLPAGRIQKFFKDIGLFLALGFFLGIHFKFFGKINIFEQQKAVPVQNMYTMLGIFGSALILWISEAIPNYLTSMILVLSMVYFSILPEEKVYSYLGSSVMILNIASFILASMLVASGLMKRIALKLIVTFGEKATTVFWFFLIFNFVLGAFINATAAKAALLMPLFMVISAVYGAKGGDNRNNFGRNLVLQNLLGINVSCCAFMTGSAANLVAASMIEDIGYKIYYIDWVLALGPLALIVMIIGWIVGTRMVFPIPAAEQVPTIEGGTRFLEDEYHKLGKLTVDEVKAAVIFLVVLVLWATDKLHGISATAVALFGAIVSLMPSISFFPRIGVINWNRTDIPWHLLMFSFGAYALGGGLKATNIVGLFIHDVFKSFGISPATPKIMIFLICAVLFLYSSMLTQSKTARTLIFFPIILEIAQKFNYDVLGFALPMAFFINQVYVFYFNSKPATICYLSNHYSNWESFKYGITMMTIVLILVILWTQYYMPLLGYRSQLW